MFKKNLFIYLIAFTSISSSLFSQSSLIKDPLIRVNFGQTEINAADSVGYWFKYNSLSTKYYYGHAKTDSSEYFVTSKHISYNTPGEPNTGWGYSLENALNADESHVVYWSNLLPSSDPYLLTTTYQTLKINNGIWILFGCFGYVFVTNGGEIYNSYLSSTLGSNYSLRHIAGQVGDKYAAVFLKTDSSKYLFLLADINNAPNIEALPSDEIFFSDSILPIKVAHLKDDLYVVQTTNNELRLHQLSGNTFNFRKTFFGNAAPWEMMDNKLIIFSLNSITKYSFNNADSTFSYESSMSPMNLIYYDRDYKYGAVMQNDSLIIYDAKTANKLYSIYRNNINLEGDLVVDSPYVYLHRVSGTIGISNDINENADLTYKLSAYPNPFNPQTTIAFTIPNAGKVELAVYDILGRKVTELLNEYRDKGSYEIKFNGSDLASGIYFYTIKAGNFVKTNKMILLK